MRVEKVVSALPGVLDPDTVYFVRVGTGFDTFVTDSTGSVAYSQNAGTGGALRIVGGYRASTATNVNASTAGVTIPWDDAGNRRQDTGISINAASQVVTVAGTPNLVELSVTMKIAISNSSSVQRPNQIVEVIRSDGLIIGASATGYIRDATDHEDSSHNIYCVDYSPLEGGSYRVLSKRETNSSGVVSLDPLRSQFVVMATP